MFSNLPLLFINRILRDEVWARKRLAGHAGQTARVEVGNLVLRVTVDTEGLLQPAKAAACDDVSVSLPAAALGVLAENPAEITRHAHIEGSAALADTLATLLQHLRPDLAGWLAPFVGDVMAVRTTRAAHSVARAGISAASQGEAILRGVLQERGPAIVNRREFEEWRSGLEDLRARLEKLEARGRR